MIAWATVAHLDELDGRMAKVAILVAERERR
jgi:hypothetical protein